MKWNDKWSKGDLVDELNRRIIIQSKSIAYNSYNEPIETWSDSKAIWAAIINSGGGELYVAQKKVSTTEAVFKVRARMAVTAENRIKYDNRIFEVLTADDMDEAHVLSLIYAKEVV